MAAPLKRPHEGGDFDVGEQIMGKQTCIDLSQNYTHDVALNNFMQWADGNNFQVSAKVRVGKEGSCAQYGMVAVDDIPEGEVLFQIPRPLLLSPQTSAIANLLNSEKESIESGSGWVPLLLALMYEYHNPTSTWRPYLDLLPHFDQLDLPMFWSRSELEEELKGTGIVSAVDRDLKSISREFESVVLPFVKSHKDVFKSAEFEDLQFYKKMVAFVMAYSFTEPLKSCEQQDDSDDEEETTSPPMMVPMADILNHVAKNNAHLCFEKDCLKMVASRDVKMSEEVFNTYGELSNGLLLQMYGFAEAYPYNHHDTVEVPVKYLIEHASRLPVNSEELIEEKKTFLKSVDLLDEDSTFVVGVEGVLTDEELESILKVLVMDRSQFKEHREKEGWSDADEDTHCPSENSFIFDNMKQLPEDWKILLKQSCQTCLSQYKNSDEDGNKQTKLPPKEGNTRQTYSRYTRIGQKKLLQKLVDSVS